MYSFSAGVEQYDELPLIASTHIFITLAGDIEARDKGSLVAHENGVATPFGITGAQSRGVMMVSPKDEIYRDMIIGLHQRPGDLRVNICKVSIGAR